MSSTVVNKKICGSGDQTTPTISQAPPTSDQTPPTSDQTPPIVVFCGPSGSGKSTLIGRLQSDYPKMFAFSVSHTTRQPRPGEQNGRHYHFVDRQQMTSDIAAGKFLEHAEYSGNLYGTSLAEVRRIGGTGAVCLLDIDVQGVRQVKSCTALTSTPIQYVCVKPPSLQVLEQRLRGRNTDSEQAIQRRLEATAAELHYCSQPNVMDAVIVNQDLDTAYRDLTRFLQPIIHQLSAK